MYRPAPALALLLLLSSRPAAGGIAGTLFSGVTAADPAAVYWNPGAMTLMEGTRLMVNSTVSPLRLHYQRDTPSGNDGTSFARADVLVAAPKLTLGLVTDATLDRWRFGLGLAFPMVDGAQWDRTYGNRPSSTRYYALEGRQVMFIIGGAAAYRITRFLSVGVGVDLIGAWLLHEVMTDWGAKINQLSCAALGGFSCRLDAPFPREDPQNDGLTRVEGVGLGVGVSGGLLLTPWPWLRLGAGVHSGGGDVTIPVDISAQVPDVARSYIRDNFPTVALPELQARGEVTFHTPVIVTAGAAVLPRPRLELALDFHWVNTSATSIMLASITRTTTKLVGDQVLVKAREDNYFFALRGSYQLLDRLTLGLRVEFDSNARPDAFVTPVSLDFDKLSFHVAAIWRLTPWLALEAEYGHYVLFERRITRSQFQPNAFPTTPEEEGVDKPTATGLYTGEADLFGLGVSMWF